LVKSGPVVVGLKQYKEVKEVTLAIVSPTFSKKHDKGTLAEKFAPFTVISCDIENTALEGWISNARGIGIIKRDLVEKCHWFENGYRKEMGYTLG
jgi:hypothetical protein